MSATSTPSAVKLYRQLGTLIRRLPEPQRTNATKKWKNDFRLNASVAEVDVPDLLKVSLNDEK